MSSVLRSRGGDSGEAYPFTSSSTLLVYSVVASVRDWYRSYKESRNILPQEVFRHKLRTICNILARGDADLLKLSEIFLLYSPMGSVFFTRGLAGKE